MPSEQDKTGVVHEFPANPSLQMLWADGVGILHRDNPSMIVFRFANVLPDITCEVARVAISKEQAQLMVKSLATVLDYWPEKPTASDSVAESES